LISNDYPSHISTSSSPLQTLLNSRTISSGTPSHLLLISPLAHSHLVPSQNPSMSLVSLEQKLSELRRCDKDGCGRWWHKSDFKFTADETYDNFFKCPHCREAKPKPTKYWHGDLTGPREPPYEYPARMPRSSQVHPLPLNPSGDRQSSTKRQMSGSSDLLANTPTQNKKLKMYQQQVGVEKSPSTFWIDG
jgi:hypothetical protein